MFNLTTFLSDTSVGDEIIITIINAANYQQIEFDESTVKRYDRPSNKKTIPVESKSKSYEFFVTSSYCTNDVDLVLAQETPQ